MEARFLDGCWPTRAKPQRWLPAGKAGAGLMWECPELVTAEPASDDQEVFGKAWPRVQEWHELKKAQPGRGRSLTWLDREERIRELVVALLEEHGMTLPPETYPLRVLARDSQLSW